MAELKSLYDDDFLAWSKQQAEALRAEMRNGSNQSLDFGNLAEEIEDLGKSVRRELQSQIRRVIRHLLKLKYSPAKEPRRGWAESVVDARAEIEDLLEASPSFRTELDHDIERQMQRGIDLALRDLGRYEEVDAATIAALRATFYTEVEVLGDWFPEEPPR
jgi:BMFP domain-containing protein YqiC